MATHLSEEEQLEALKRWWNQYGKVVMVAAVIGVGGFLGFNQYQAYQQKKAQQASVLFQQFVELTSEFDEVLSSAERAQAQQLANSVRDQAGRTLYGNFADLYLAKLAMDDGDFAAAISSLEAVVARPSNEAVRDLARLRMARVHAAAGDTDRALGILSGNPTGAYAAAFAEARGDLLFSLDRLGEAHTAYQSALQALGPGQSMRHNLVQLKLDNTRVGEAAGALPLPINPHGINPHAMPAGPEGV